MLGDKKAMELLVFFIENDSEYSLSDIMKKAKMAKATAIRLLKLMSEKKILNVRKKGHLKLYKLNKENRFVKRIREML